MMRFKLDQALSDRVKRYMQRGGGTPLPDAEAIARSLMHALPHLSSGLPDVCKGSLSEWLSEIRSLLDYLVRNDSRAKDTGSLIREIQYQSEFWAGAPPEGFTFRDDGSGEVAVDPAQEAEWKKLQHEMEGWKPHVSEETFGQWERRIAQLGTSTMPGVLLQKYCKLVSEIEPFMGMVSRRCAAFDRYIDQLLDDERDTELRKRLEADLK